MTVLTAFGRAGAVGGGLLVPTFVGEAHSSVYTGNTPLTWPAGVEDGDYAFVRSYFRDAVGSSPTLPTGFSAFGTEWSTGVNMVYGGIRKAYRLCDGTETGSLTIPQVGLSNWLQLLIVLRHVNPTTVIRTGSSASGGPSRLATVYETQVIGVPMTVSGPGALKLIAVVDDAAPTTPPTPPITPAGLPPITVIAAGKQTHIPETYWVGYQPASGGTVPPETFTRPIPTINYYFHTATELFSFA